MPVETLYFNRRKDKPVKVENIAPCPNSGQRVVIMAAGIARRWKNYLGIPKQLIQVQGEPIIKRTIRLLKEQGITDIWVTVRTKGQYGNLGVNEFVNHENNHLSIDRILGAQELAPAIYLFGDVYYTEKAIDIILSDKNEHRFFGRRYPGVLKSNREIYAVKVDDFIIQKAQELRELHASHKIIDSLVGHLLILCLGYGINPKTRDHTATPEQLTPLFTDIDDETTDFDLPNEYDRFIKLNFPKKNKPDWIMKSPPIKTYYSLSRMNYDLVHNFLPKIPSDIDLVVGIPRDGIMVAYLISISRNIPMTDLTSFCAGVENYKPGIKHRKEQYEIKNILLVDDICASGLAMRDAKKQISPHLNGKKLYCAAVYTSKPDEKLKSGLVDFVGPVLVGPRAYEWTHTDAVYLPNTFMDMDGIMCPDWAGGEDYGKRYEEWLGTVPLKLRPQNIGTIITWRREEHREQTVAWLQKNGITFDELIMANRVDWPGPAEYKAHFYKNSSARLFIESSERQAEKIYKLTEKPVVCFETNKAWGVG